MVKYIVLAHSLEVPCQSLDRNLMVKILGIFFCFEIIVLALKTAFDLFPQNFRECMNPDTGYRELTSFFLISTYCCLQSTTISVHW